MKKNLVQLAMSIVLLVLLSKAVYAQWVQTNGPFGKNVFAIAASGSNVIAGTSGGLYLTVNKGTNWTEISDGLPANAFVEALATSGSQDVFAGTYDGGVFRSINNGASWIAVNSGLNSHDIVSIAVGGNSIFASTNDSNVFQSINNGTSWSKVNSSFTNKIVLSFAINGGNIFAGTNGDGVFRSTNNGATWVGVNEGFDWDKIAYSFALNGGNIFAGTANGVYLSTNDGTNWAAVDSGLPWNTPIRSIAVSGNQELFAGIDNEVFLSTNSGITWKKTNFPDRLMSLAVIGDTVFVGTIVNGVWRRPISEMTGGVNSSSKHCLKQGGFRIHAPSNGTSIATIGFLLQHPDHVTINIYNPSGKKIASFFNTTLGSGSYCLPWNTRKIAAGTYLVRGQIGSNTVVANIPICH
jgi:photosystem II stability/assembly factor-like uncharacterized protein